LSSVLLMHAQTQAVPAGHAQVHPLERLAAPNPPQDVCHGRHHHGRLGPCARRTDRRGARVRKGQPSHESRSPDIYDSAADSASFALELGAPRPGPFGVLLARRGDVRHRQRGRHDPALADRAQVVWAVALRAAALSGRRIWPKKHPELDSHHLPRNTCITHLSLYAESRHHVSRPHAVAL
jgi:hypothetical protein